MSDLYRINRLQKLLDRAKSLAADVDEHASPVTKRAAHALVGAVAADIATLESGLKGGAKQAHQLHGPLPKGDA